MSNAATALSTSYSSIRAIPEYRRFPDFWVWFGDALVKLNLPLQAMPIYYEAIDIYIDNGIALANDKKDHTLGLIQLQSAQIYIEKLLKIVPVEASDHFCRIYLMKALCERYLDTDSRTLGSYFVKASKCLDTYDHSLIGMHELQAKDSMDPVLHEYWADIVVKKDEIQAAKHYEVCGTIHMNGEDVISSLRCFEKILELYEKSIEVRKNYKDKIDGFKAFVDYYSRLKK